MFKSIYLIVQIIFIPLFLISKIFAEEVSIVEVIPNGKVDTEVVSTISIKFNKNIVEDINEKVPLAVADEIKVTKNQCSALSWDAKDTLNCYLKYKTYSALTYDVEISEKLLEKYKEIIIPKSKTSFMHSVGGTVRDNYIGAKFTDYDHLFRVLYVRCSYLIYNITGTTHEPGTILLEENNFECKNGDNIQIVFSKKIDFSSVKNFLIFEDKKVEEAVNRQILNNYNSNKDYNSNMLSFYFSSGDERNSFMINQELKQVDESEESVWGPSLFSLNILPEPFSFSIPYSFAVIEKNGPQLLPFDYTNINKMGLNYKIANSSSELSDLYQKKASFYSIPMNFEKNKSKHWFVDLKELGKGEEKKSYYLEGEFSYEEIESGFIEARRASGYYNYDGLPTATIPIKALVTDLGIHYKEGYFNSLAFVFRISTGESLKDALVTFYDGNSGAVLYEGKTNSEGIILLDDLDKKNGTVGKVVASFKDEFSFISFNDNGEIDFSFDSGISPYDFNLNYVKKSSQNNFIASAITDRPIYRPGEDVRLKIFTRKWSNEFLDFIKDYNQVKVSIISSRSERVFEENIEINDFGTSVTEFKLSEVAKTGTYHIYVQPLTSSYERFFAGEFQVEDFRLSPFKISVGATVKGKEISVDTTGEYHFGGKLKDVEGEVLIYYREKKFKPNDDRYLDFFSYPGSPGGTSIVQRDFFRYNENGNFQKKYNISHFERFGSGEYTVEVSAKDAKGAKVAGSKSIHFFDRPAHLGVKMQKWWYLLEESFNPEVVLLDPEEKEIFGRKAIIKLSQTTYLTTRRKGSGNYYHYDNSRKVNEVGRCEFSFNISLSSCGIKLTKPGRYDYEVSLSNDNSIPSVKGYFWVYGDSGYVTQEIYDHSRIDLMTDRIDYKLGDELDLFITSPYTEAEALVTIERDGVLHSEKIKITSSLHRHKIKIDKKKYLPGFFISVVVIKGRTSEKIEGNLDLGKPRFNIGYTKVNVSTKDTHHLIKAETKKKKYQPGDEVELSIEVKNSMNKGVEAEVAIAIIDDAVLQLVSDYVKKYEIHDDFYKLTSTGVLNYQTLVKLAGRQSFGLKGGNSGGGGGIDASLLRDDFKAVAHWEPQVETDKNGNAKIKFLAPDNLTNWKALIVTIDKDNNFGYGETIFNVSKPLMIIPALPNFLTEQDRFVAKYEVFNKTEKDQNVEMTVMSDTFHIGQKKLDQKIKDNSSHVFEFLTQTQFPGEYNISSKASGGEFRDSILTNIPVLALKTNAYKKTTGVLKGSERVEEILFPKGTKEGTETLSIALSNNMIKGLVEAFEYVLMYPYGCWEQRMSKVVTWAQYHGVRDFLPPIVGKDNTKSEPLEIVREFLDQAEKYQNADGGMKYYPSDSGSSNEYLSIYTAEVFVIVKNIGIELPEGVVEKLKKYLYSRLNSSWPQYYDKKTKDTGNAKLVYVLTELGEKNLDSHISNLIKDKDSLSDEAISYVMLVLHGKEKYLSEFKYLKEKMQKRFLSKEYRFDFSNENKLGKNWLYTEMRNQCQLYNTFIRTDSFVGKDDSDLMINYIINSRKNGHWYNTQENTFCLMAVSEYLGKNKISSNNKFNVTIKLDENTISKKDLTLSNSVVDINREIIKIGEGQKLSLKPKDSNVVYYTVTQKYVDYNNFESIVDNGISVKKHIFKLDQKKLTWDYLVGDLHLKVGDVLKIVLIVKSNEVRYNVIVDDPLVGAFEPINYNLDNSSKLTQIINSPTVSEHFQTLKSEYSSNYFKGSGFHHVDLRLYAAQFYADQLSSNVEHYAEYSVSVGVEGNFTMSSTKAEEMYYPDIFGITPMRKVQVTK